MNHPRPLTVGHIECFPVRMHFRLGVEHGLARRTFSDNLLVRVETTEGCAGYGESVPRDYVTGETVDGAFNRVIHELPSLAGKTFDTPDALVSFLRDRFAHFEGGGNAAFCALELALLTCAARHWETSLSGLTGLRSSRETLIYSLVIPFLADDEFEAFCRKVAPYRFSRVKVKVDGRDPVAMVARTREIFGPDVEIRVDANCAWNPQDASRFLDEMSRFDIAAVEQPFPAEALEATAELKRHTQLPIVLDESVITAEDVMKAAEAHAGDIVNVRVSKCGGLRAATGVIGAARARGYGVQLGAQVGESCILSSAGAVLAAAVPDFRWHEGCFGTHLLSEDLCGEEIRFGPRGEFDVGTVANGVTVLQERVDRARERYERDG